ncbi:helix-turn-helix transcriptional regulator [Enterococcus rotai]|uniref:helix-turn-helix transcriptional regulator n=1 Tax=Enterococcus rotai TaxID=118060 RepID=UPI0032B3A36D
MEGLNVILGEKESNSLKTFIYNLLTDQVQQVKEDASLNKVILNQAEVAEFLGVSRSYIGKYEKLGMPYSSIGSRKFYDKSEVRTWIMQQQIEEVD